MADQPTPEGFEPIKALLDERHLRELKNAIEYAFIVCASGTIEVEHLPAELVERYAGVAPRPESSTMAELEAQFLYAALARNGFNRAATARELGVHKTTLWRKMKKLDVQVPTAD